MAGKRLQGCKRLPGDVFVSVFQFVLQLPGAKRLLSGKTVGVDSTTLEANTAMKSIVRKDTGVRRRRFVAVGMSAVLLSAHSA